MNAAVNDLREILPVFAGMIPATWVHHGLSCDSPRIRGDDPVIESDWGPVVEFSPYSRG